MRPARLAALAFAASLAFGSAAAAQGIGAEEFTRLRPQAPRDVTVVMSDGLARVTWRPPPAPPEGSLAYRRQPLRYRVRRLDGGRSRVVGETAGRSLLDRTGPPGPDTRYVVTTAPGAGPEGARSEEARPR